MLVGPPGYISLVMAMRMVSDDGRHAPSCPGSGHDAHLPFRGQPRIVFRQFGLLRITRTLYQPSRHMRDFIDARANGMAKVRRRCNMGRHLETGHVGFDDDHRDKSRMQD